MGPYSTGFIIGILFFSLNMVNSQDMNASDSPICSKHERDCRDREVNNVIMEFDTIHKETDCQNACKELTEIEDCQAYTWHEANWWNDDECFLLRDCYDGHSNDKHYYSGPKDCFCRDPQYQPDGGYWDCHHSVDYPYWEYQTKNCDLKCTSGAGNYQIECIAPGQWDQDPGHAECRSGCPASNLTGLPDSWSCMRGQDFVTPSNDLIEEGAECKLRCGQGQDSDGSYKCQGGSWNIENGKPTCNNNKDVLYFFTTTNGEDSKDIENPPGSHLINNGEFTCKSDGLHLFTLNVKSGGKVQLQLNDEETIQIPEDGEKSNSFTIALNLTVGNTVGVTGTANWKFSGLSLYSSNAEGQYLWGSGAKQLQVQNADQPIILDKQEHTQDVTYNDTIGAITIHTAGVYMATLNLGSEDSAYASLNINGEKTLGLGEDREGRNLMSNFILKEFEAGDTIQPTLEALGKISTDSTTQLSMISLLPATEIRDMSFCAYSSQYQETEETVTFDDQMFLSNDGKFSKGTGTYTHPDDEDFNPRRFYLLSATAFMGKIGSNQEATLTIEQVDKDGNKYELGSAKTNSEMRSMLQVTVIAEMDQHKNQVRVKAKGFLDAGPHAAFTTFCGFRLGL